MEKVKITLEGHHELMRKLKKLDDLCDQIFDYFYLTYYDLESKIDYEIINENDVITDLTNIGYVNVTTEVRKSYSDSGHSHWIYIKAFKP